MSIVETDSAEERELKVREIEAIMRRDKKCPHLVAQKIVDSQLELIKDATSAYDAWMSLLATLEERVVTSKLC